MLETVTEEVASSANETTTEEAVIVVQTGGDFVELKEEVCVIVCVARPLI